MTMLSKRRIISCLLSGVWILALNSCARNPVTGDRQVVLISENQEVSYGREAHPQVLAEYGVVEETDLQSYLDQVGQSLARVSHRPELDWHFTVVDVAAINAFALPGGYIYFTRQILAYMNSEAELAGVLGHEIGHVTARHSVSQMSRAQLLQLGVGVGSVLSPTAYQFGDLAQAGLGLLFLRYGRDDERQSDQLGIDYMSLAGYDPREMSQFFVVFQDLKEQQKQSVPGWLSTHPDPPDRIDATASAALKIVGSRPHTPWKIGREAFLNKIAGLTFGQNSREGFQQDDWFLHPDLMFKIPLEPGTPVKVIETGRR